MGIIKNNGVKICLDDYFFVFQEVNKKLKIKWEFSHRVLIILKQYMVLLKHIYFQLENNRKVTCLYFISKNLV